MRRSYRAFVIITLGTVVICLGDSLQKHKEKRVWPEITRNEECEPGKVYKMKCNVCRCNPKKILICTNRQCRNDNTTQEHSVRGLSKFEHTISYSKKEFCPPGKTYDDDCRTCVCNSQSEALCTGPSVCKAGGITKSDHKKNLQGLLRTLELRTLPLLDHIAVTCSPGNFYRLDCIACVCLQDGNLICDSVICADYEEMNRREMAKYSGRKCAKKGLVRDQLMQECVYCACHTDQLECKVAAGCVPEQMSRKYQSLDIEEQKCEPGGIYRSHCNKCYCQPDGSMRCTQKACLNYKQAQELLARQKALDENGL